jgi:DNA-binding helix-hairpin-helix protein with protein kinase domain
VPDVVLLVVPVAVPFCPPMLPVPEAEPVDPLPAPAPDCAIIHALASTRIAKTWSKRFIVIISLP